MTTRRLALSTQRVLPPLLGLAAVLVSLLPLSPGSGAAVPDLLYCLLIAFVVRAPAAAPAVVVLALGLFADLMLSRPVGLGALGLLIVTELFRAPDGARRDWSPVREWLFAMLAFGLMIAGMALILRATFTDAPSPVALRRHMIATTIAYPFIAAAVGWLVGRRPRRAAPAEMGRLP